MILDEMHVVVISGGSEIVSLSVVESIVGMGVGFSIVSLVNNSIFQDTQKGEFFTSLFNYIDDWPVLKDVFIEHLDFIKNQFSSNIIIFPTEDAGLRLLNELRDDVLKYAEFSRARALLKGGVDKAEVIECLEMHGLSNPELDGCVINSPSQALEIFECYGEDAVFKPALKPLDMDLSGLGASGVKVITSISPSETKNEVLRRLESNWGLSQRWIAQPRLKVGPRLEKSICLSRGREVSLCQVEEQLKYPVIGGTAIWVKTSHERKLADDFIPKAKAMDLMGICEASYLPDSNGIYRLVEANTRPWLQVGLLRLSGFDIIKKAIFDLLGEVAENQEFSVEIKNWIHLERTVQSFLRGGISSANWLDLGRAVFSKNTTIAGYGTTIPRMKQKLLMRSFGKILKV